MKSVLGRVLARLFPAAARSSTPAGTVRPPEDPHQWGFPVAIAQAGPRFSPPPGRARICGRIGGVAGASALRPAELRAAAALEAALGAGGRALVSEPGPGSTGFVADHDACEASGRALESHALEALARAGRLGEVTGAFAAAWREPDGTICLARDAIGERTLYWTERCGRLIFASTMRALLASGLVERTLDLEALLRYLAYAYVPGRRTMVAGVSELEAGELLRWRAGSLEHRALWQLPPERDADAADEETLRTDLRQRLEQAVRRLLPAGEPVTCTLSGGVDSSLVAALARRLHDAPVRTLSVAFGGEHASELPFSSMVARHLATDHTIVEVRAPAVIEHLDGCIAELSEPIGDPLTVPNALLFRHAAPDAGVVLNGEGGDPCFGGPKNLPMLLSELYGDTRGPGRERAYLRAHQKCFDDLDELVAPEVLAAVPPDALEQHLAPFLEDPRQTRFVTRLQAVNLRFKGAHHILSKVDAMSAPFGVLPRAPLFDRAVVEAAFAIPPSLKLAGSVEKYLLKRAVEDLLPAEILSRPKSGMLVPVERWFTGPLLPLARERLLDGLAPRGLMSKPWLERLVSGRTTGLRPRRGVKIWLLITLEAWLRTVLDP